MKVNEVWLTLPLPKEIDTLKADDTVNGTVNGTDDTLKDSNDTLNDNLKNSDGTLKGANDTLKGDDGTINVTDGTVTGANVTVNDTVNGKNDIVNDTVNDLKEIQGNPMCETLRETLRRHLEWEPAMVGDQEMEVLSILFNAFEDIRGCRLVVQCVR